MKNAKLQIDCSKFKVMADNFNINIYKKNIFLFLNSLFLNSIIFYLNQFKSNFLKNYNTVQYNDI
jgi:hypothetical protein